MIIAGTYFSDQVLETSFSMGIFGVLMMSIPLLMSMYSKKAAKKIISVFTYSTLAFILFLSTAMCPPYGIFPFAFFGSFVLFIGVLVLRKELKSTVIPLFFSALVMLLIGSRVPSDIQKAQSGEMKSRAEFMKRLNQAETEFQETKQEKSK